MSRDDERDEGNTARWEQAIQSYKERIKDAIPPRVISRSAYMIGFKEGQEAMQERAVITATRCTCSTMEAIRALPIEEAP